MEPACEHRAVALVFEVCDLEDSVFPATCVSGAAWAIVRVGLLWVQGLGFRMV